MTYKSIEELIKVFKDKYPVWHTIHDFYKRHKQGEFPSLQLIDSALDIEFGSFVPINKDTHVRVFCFKTKEDKDKFIKYITEYKNKT